MLNNNIVWHNHHIIKEEHSELKKQKLCILWFAGLSGSGKSTIANAAEVRLNKFKKHIYLLNEDNIRMGLNKGLTFSDEDWIENIRRIGEVSNLFLDATVRESRKMAYEFDLVNQIIYNKQDLYQPWFIVR